MYNKIASGKIAARIPSKIFMLIFSKYKWDGHLSAHKCFLRIKHVGGVLLMKEMLLLANEIRREDSDTDSESDEEEVHRPR